VVAEINGWESLEDDLKLTDRAMGFDDDAAQRPT